MEEHAHKWVGATGWIKKPDRSYEFIHYRRCKVKDCDVARRYHEKDIGNYTSLEELNTAAAEFSEPPEIIANCEDYYGCHSAKINLSGYINIDTEELARLKADTKTYQQIQKDRQKRQNEEAIEAARKLLKEAGEL